MIEQLPRERNEENKEQNEGHTEKDRDIDRDIGRNLDELNASVLLSEQERSRHNAENQESVDTKHSIDELKSGIHPVKKIESREQRAELHYESLSEEDIMLLAEQGRKKSAENVQQIVNETDFIPERLKKITT